MTVVFTLTLPAIMVVVIMGRPGEPAHPWEHEAMALGVMPDEISAGESVYRASCVVCHGQNGEGVPRLGKPLRNSAYVQSKTDEELFSLIVEGRLPTDPANTTGSPMPPRGGQSLTDDKISQVVTYLRVMQDPTQPTVSVDDWVIDMGAIAAGASGPSHELYIMSCSSCHGEHGEGVEGNGKPLKNSEFVASQTDKELMTFIKMGRPIWDANNTTGLDMPPKGGNPALSDEQLAEIIEYIRSIQD